MAKKRLIDSNALKDFFCEQCYIEFADEVCVPDDCHIRNAIMAAPTVDAVEVVRCRECVYWDGRGYDGRCEAPNNGLIREYTTYNDFCSYGERKEGDV